MIIENLYYFFISITLAICANEGPKVDVCKTRLIWVPKNYYSVYMTFLNDVNCPSWTTRNIITKRSNNKNSLVIPTDTPFAFACGACYSVSSWDANLTATSRGVETAFEPLNGEKGSSISINSYTECLVSHGLTAPITKPGTIECQLNRGSKKPKESISFTTRKVPVDEEPEKEIHVKKGEAKLRCPETTLKNKRNIVYVWHSTLTGESSEVPPEIVVASLKREVSILPSREVLRISCSVYDFMNPYKVWRTSYVVYSEKERVEEEEVRIQKSEWSLSGGLKKPRSSKSGSYFTIANPVVWLIGGAALLGIAGMALSIGYCRCANQSKLPNLSSQENESYLITKSKVDAEQYYTNNISSSN